MMRSVLTLAILVLSGGVGLRAASADGLVAALKARLDGVRTYTADVRIAVDIPFLKAPEQKARIFFEAPDRTAVQSDGFAMIPKQGADMSAARVLSMPHTAVLVGTATFQGTAMQKVRIIPNDDDADIKVATLWVDTTLMVVRKVESTTKTNGTIVAELVYDNGPARSYGLPSYVKLMFDVGAFELPKTMTGDFDAPSTPKGKGPQQAVVQLWYTGWTFNKPIPKGTFGQ